MKTRQLRNLCDCIRRQMLLLLMFLLTGLIMPVKSAAQAGALTESIDDANVVRRDGDVHRFARREFDRGLTDRNRKMEGMVLVLNRRPGTDKELDNLITQQHDPSSPLYQKWLTPQEFDSRFGITDEDLNVVVEWLKRHGFSIDDVAHDAIRFNGTTAMVEDAFHTQMREYLVNGELHHANATPPAIPRALSKVVKGVLSLHDFRAGKTRGPATQLVELPPTGTGMTPGDFATIYDLKPLYAAGIDGSGQSIAIAAEEDINLNDVRSFRSNFGLPPNDPVLIYNGPPPSLTSDQDEARLDVEWAGAVAPGATVKLVVTAMGSGEQTGVELSADYIVRNNIAPILSMSYALCEAEMTDTRRAFIYNMWQRAVNQGISVFVSSGDSGPAGCDDPNKTAMGSVMSVNGFCSTPFNVCVGGTIFNDQSNPAQYWDTIDLNHSSAISYIPERAWNQSALMLGSGIWATGGGYSVFYPKPSWQNAPSAPISEFNQINNRCVPDVSLSAAAHDYYQVYDTATGWRPGGGTSASTPAFAGIMALVMQKSGWRGNPNQVLYEMARRQYINGSPLAFHDVTAGHNVVPMASGVAAGYRAGPGYDLVTGLGSVDAAMLVDHWNEPDFIFSAFPTSLTVPIGGQQGFFLYLAPVGGLTAPITVTASGQPAGVSIMQVGGETAVPLAPIGFNLASQAWAVAAGPQAIAGTYIVTLTAVGGGLTHVVNFNLVVQAQPYFYLAAPVNLSHGFVTGTFALNMVPGSSAQFTVTTGTIGSFNAPITIGFSSFNFTSPGVTVAPPAAIPAPGAGTSVITVSVPVNAVVGSSLQLELVATGGGVSQELRVPIHIVAPPQQLLGNPGFENGGAIWLPWLATPNVIDGTSRRAPHSGLWKAWLNGWGTTHADILYQDVTISANVSTAILSYWLHVDTAETTTTTPFDTLTVWLVDPSTNIIKTTLATYSNLNAAPGYSQKLFDLTSWKGQTIRIYFYGSEDASLQTSFVIDDTSLMVQ
jgi:pseudomonalisin